MGKDDPPPYSPYGAPTAGFVPPPPQSGYPQQPQPGYPQPPQPGIYPHPQPTTTNVIVTHAVTAVPLGPDSINMVCPSCHHQIRTTVESKPTTKTHLFALLLCLFGCWPCFCIPYCTDSCQGQSHTCPNCGSYIGMYEN